MAEPDDDDYESIADELDAAVAYVAEKLTPQEKQIRLESIMGIIQLERYLKNQDNGS